MRGSYSKLGYWGTCPTPKAEKWGTPLFIVANEEGPLFELFTLRHATIRSQLMRHATIQIHLLRHATIQIYLLRHATIQIYVLRHATIQIYQMRHATIHIVHYSNSPNEACHYSNTSNEACHCAHCHHQVTGVTGGHGSGVQNMCSEVNTWLVYESIRPPSPPRVPWSAESHTVECGLYCSTWL